MQEITVKKIPVSENMYVLCVPDNKKYYSFYLCHDKHAATLKLFGTTSVRDPGDEMLQYIAAEGFKNAKDEYLNLAAFIDGMEE